MLRQAAWPLVVQQNELHGLRWLHCPESRCHLRRPVGCGGTHSPSTAHAHLTLTPGGGQSPKVSASDTAPLHCPCRQAVPAPPLPHLNLGQEGPPHLHLVPEHR